MFSKINTFYSSITNIGIFNTLSNDVKKEVKLLNVYAVIWLHLIFIFIISDYIGGVLQLRVVISHFIGIIVMLSIYKLHKLKKHIIAKGIWMCYAITHFFLLSSIFNKGWYIEYFFLLIPCFALSLYNNINIARAILVLSFLLFLCPTYVFNIYPDLYKEQLKIPSILGIFGSLFMLILYYKKLNLKNEKLLALERDNVISDKIILEKQENELRKLNEFKSHFFVNLSHEIRTPLTLIQGYTNQLNYKDSETELLEKTDVIKNQCQQVQNIINNILHLSKMESSQFQITTTPVHLHTFLEKHFINFEQLFNKKNIEFCLNNTNLKTTVLIEEDLFSKAITNLLSNALKFTPAGGKVSINTNFDDNELKINIKDNGIGITKKDSESIFERFYQAKNDITKSQGSGIGLAYTKSIVNAHNFSINVESNINKGACFSIIIPKQFVKSILKNTVSSANNQNKIYKPKQVKTIKVKQKNTKHKILLIEDHEHMRTYLKKVLKNYTVIEANNGKEALSIIDKNSFDLIITDYMMPVMDGVTLVKQLKKQQNKIPIIVLTARTDNHGKLSMLRLGIDGYLYKPFMEEELLINIKNSIKLYNNIKEFDRKNSHEDLYLLNKYAEEFNSKITSFIKKNIDSPLLTVDFVSEHMKVSKSTLNRKVKSLLGQTVNQLVQETRLEKARNLRIADPYASKKQIAEAVGVTNTTYLFDKLKERYGI